MKLQQSIAWILWHVWNYKTYDNFEYGFKNKIKTQINTFYQIKMNKKLKKLKAHDTNLRTPNEHEFGCFKKIECNWID